MNVQSRIDWLTFTHHHIDTWQNYLPPMVHDDIGKELRPLPHYAKAYELLPAGRVDIAKTDKQGVMVTYTGSDMTTLMEAGINTQKLLESVSEYGKPTRIDYAVDVRESRYGMEPLWQELQMLVANGKFKSSGKPSTEMKDKTNGGYTQYFGSYKSDKYIRLYDKAAQLDLLGIAMREHLKPPDHWTRLELVMKADYASNFLADCLQWTYKDAGINWIKKSLDFPMSERYQQAIDARWVWMTKLQKPIPRWQKWMDTSVIQSIRKHLDNPDDRAFMLQWLSIVTNDVWNAEHGFTDDIE